MENKNIQSILVTFCFALLCFLLFILYPKVAIIPLLAATFSLIPYYVLIWKALIKKQLDLSLPPIVTIYLLLFLGKGNVALIFILIILLGQLFKTIILEKIKTSITNISNKLPKTAVIKSGETKKEIPIFQINVGDRLIVKSGERVATDALLIFDNALIDESVVTGESRPIRKEKGDKLLAGSINMGNYFEAEAISTAERSTLLQIQNLVIEAQNDKAPLARVVNLYAWITIAAALTGAVVIFLVTHNIFQALSFWIAVVPVIFAIIVPVATTIGITILAKQGILVKNSPALENLTTADTILFDKTGTITEGTPEIENILEIGRKKEEILQIAASIEDYSNHPLAIPILDEAKRQNIQLLPLTHLRTLTGEGMVAKRDGKEIILGNMTLMQGQKIHIAKEHKEVVFKWENKGATPVFVGENKQVIGVILLMDKLRAGAKPLFSYLAQKKYKTLVITGDKKEVAQSITEQLRGTSLIAEVTPAGKVKAVEEKLKQGKRVIMVGDGINDAPALAKAQVGIAMGGKGMDITLNAADIVLLNNDIFSISQMITVSKKTFQIIKQDVALATSIHILTAIFVLIGSITLVETTFIHEASSVLVLLNTLRLFRIRWKK